MTDLAWQQTEGDDFYVPFDHPDLAYSCPDCGEMMPRSDCEELAGSSELFCPHCGGRCAPTEG